jgi:transcriptional regulator with XRE-family HTH domain
VPAKDPTLRKFGDNVRSRREALDLSQEQLAERADLDRTVSRDQFSPYVQL